MRIPTRGLVRCETSIFMIFATHVLLFAVWFLVSKTLNAIPYIASSANRKCMNSFSERPFKVAMQICTILASPWSNLWQLFVHILKLNYSTSSASSSSQAPKNFLMFAEEEWNSVACASAIFWRSGRAGVGV